MPTLGNGLRSCKELRNVGCKRSTQCFLRGVASSACEVCRKKARTGFEREICKQLDARIFERQLFTEDLWVADKALTLRWSLVQPYGGGQRRQVRCGLPFQQLIEDAVPQTVFGQDPVDTLMRLFSVRVPEARRVFGGTCRPLRLLHANDYILEKAFVYGIVALSKWLGAERFPQGVHGRWPPAFPANLVPSSEEAPTVNLDASASSSGHVVP